MTKPKVFLTGRDGIGWALDEDLRLTKRALEGIVEFTTLKECEVVHSTWWGPLLDLPPESLADKRIIWYVPGEPYRYMSLPRHRHVVAMTGCWIARSWQAVQELRAVGIPSRLIPYAIDVNTFRPLEADPAVPALRDKWEIPANRYLIGNFHRDTEGYDLRSPKLVKGPDVFAEIVHLLWRKGCPIHVVLAGPRRHWMRYRLPQLGVPFTFVGEPCQEDDLGVNIMSRERINVLLNIIDLYVVSSRSEGGAPLNLGGRCQPV